jgi:hypothetical protein
MKLKIMVIIFVIAGVLTSVRGQDPAVTIYNVTAKAGKFGDMDITGVIMNNTSRPLRSMIVRFGIYDDNDNKIGEAADLIGEIDAGGTWKFEASGKRGKYSLDGITCDHGRLLVKDADEEIRAAKKLADKENVKRTVAARAIALSNATVIAGQKARQRSAELDSKTFQFHLSRAQAGDGYSQLRLAELYTKGIGTERNLDQAHFWLLAACTNRVERATNMLRTLPSSHEVKMP